MCEGEPYSPKMVLLADAGGGLGDCGDLCYILKFTSLSGKEGFAMEEKKPAAKKKVRNVVCGAVLAVLLGYFLLTPRGSIAFKLLIYDPVYAFTYEVAETSVDYDKNQVYILADPIIGSKDVQNRLDRWTIHRAGPLCWATYGYA